MLLHPRASLPNGTGSKIWHRQPNYPRFVCVARGSSSWDGTTLLLGWQSLDCFPSRVKKIPFSSVSWGNLRRWMCISPPSLPHLHRHSSQHPYGQRGASSHLPSRSQLKAAWLLLSQPLIQIISLPGANGARVPQPPCSLLHLPY